MTQAYRDERDAKIAALEEELREAKKRLKLIDEAPIEPCKTCRFSGVRWQDNTLICKGPPGIRADVVGGWHYCGPNTLTNGARHPGVRVAGPCPSWKKAYWRW